MGNQKTVERSSIRKLVGGSEKGDRIYQTVSSCNLAGCTGAILPIEEREELESRNINPDWDRVVFRNELRNQAKLNGVWLEKAYLDDKVLIHDFAVAATTENDIYRNPDGKTFTKVNNLSQVKGSDRKTNLWAFMDRFVSHNALFLEITYKVKGFMDNKHGFTSMVMEQPYVDAERNATQEEIDEYLKDKGFSLVGKSLRYWSNGVYIIEDARPANVLMGKDGTLYFIDTIPHSVEYLDGIEKEKK